MIVLAAGAAHCIVSEEWGARLASLAVGERQLLVSSGGRLGDPMAWGSYPMVPWAGRLREGRFQLHGRQHAVPLNLLPHAIHGTTFTQPWVVRASSPTSVSLRIDLDDPWPFAGHAQHTVELHPDRVVCTLSVTADSVAMPVQLGWHPWFAKPTGASLHFESMYVRDEHGIPTGLLATPPPPGPWDDCFVAPTSPLELRYENLIVTLTSDCDHWVVYDEQDHATCVEPQSGPPDGFNLAPHVLQPGETLTRTMSVAWRQIGQASA